jgi:hypothetical protein
MAKKRVGILTGGGELYDSFYDSFTNWGSLRTLAYHAVDGV